MAQKIIRPSKAIVRLPVHSARMSPWLTSLHLIHHYISKYAYKYVEIGACLHISFGGNSPQWARASSFTRFLDHTQRRNTVGRTPLDEWSARRIDLYLTKHNTHNRHPWPRWDSNPRSQQASGRRPTPQTARPMGPTKEVFLCSNKY